MDYEKKYKEAFKRAEGMYEQGMMLERLEYIFPELKESEDERTRKEIIDFATKVSNGFTSILANNYDFNKWIAWLEKQGIKKPAWTEEDDKMFNSALWHVKNSCGNGGKNSGEFEVYNWLKSLKDRVQPQQKQEWSKEDEGILTTITNEIYACKREAKSYEYRNYDRQIEWLKSLRPQNSYAYNPYKAVVESIAEMCDKYKLPTSDLSDFLDNVKVKCKEAKEYDAMFSQKQWKPSDEQMEALANALSLAKNCGEEYSFDLRTLYEQLEKLK